MSKVPEQARTSLLPWLLLLLALSALRVLTGGSDLLPPPPGWTHLLLEQDIQALARHRGTVWAAGRDGVWEIDGRTATVRGRLVTDPPVTYVTSLLADPDGTLWIGHPRGLLRVRDGTSEPVDLTDLPDPRVNSLLRDRDGRLWLGTWTGAAVREAEGWRVLRRQDGLLHDMVSVMFEDREGALWFGSYVAPEGGVSWYRKGRWRHLRVEDGLPHPNVTSLLEDSSEGVWIGTGLFRRGGAVRVVAGEDRLRVVERLTKAEGLAGEKVRSLARLADGSLWFGSEYDGIARRVDGRFHPLSVDQGLPHEEAKCFLQEPDGTLWIGTRRGLVRITPEALARLDDPRSATTNQGAP